MIGKKTKKKQKYKNKPNSVHNMAFALQKGWLNVISLKNVKLVKVEGLWFD